MSHRYRVTSERGYQRVPSQSRFRRSCCLAPASGIFHANLAALVMPRISFPSKGKGKPDDTWGCASLILTQKEDLALSRLCFCLLLAREPRPPVGTGWEGRGRDRKARGSYCCWQTCYLDWPDATAVRGIAGFPPMQREKRAP